MTLPARARLPTGIPLRITAAVSLRRAGEDRRAVCGAPPRAATLLGSDRDTYWVLLRPIDGDPAATASVVLLPGAFYDVRPVPVAVVPRDGTPWRRAACDR